MSSLPGAEGQVGHHCGGELLPTLWILLELLLCHPPKKIFLFYHADKVYLLQAFFNSFFCLVEYILVQVHQDHLLVCLCRHLEYQVDPSLGTKYKSANLCYTGAHEATPHHNHLVHGPSGKTSGDKEIAFIIFILVEKKTSIWAGESKEYRGKD